MKHYVAKFNPSKKGVYAISLVDEPAMEGDFIQFNKEDNDIKFAKVDESKRRIMGLILEPNKKVLRFNKEDNSYYTIEFGEQDIEDVAYNFQKQGNQNNSTLQHDGVQLEGISFVETWIVENSKVDKSTNFGFEYPKGSWIGVMQLDNQKLWDDYVQTGKVKGFSIDALMQFEQLNLNRVNMSDNKEKDNILLSAIKDGFAELKSVFNTPKKEVDKVELKEEVEEVELSETKVDEKVEFNATDFVAEMVKELQEILEPINVELKKLNYDLVEFKKENETLKEEVVKLGKQPATQSIKKTNEAPLEYSKMTNKQKMEYNLQNG